MEKLLVYFFRGGRDIRTPVEEIQGLVSHQTLHDGKVTEYHCSSPEAQFGQDLRGALERNGSSEYCFVSSQLTQQNNACVLSVEGMTCNSCVKLIEATMSQSSGVKSIKVSLEFKEAFVEYNPDVVKPAELAEGIYDMGFDAAIVTTFAPASPGPSSPLLPLPLEPVPQATPLSLVQTIPLSPDTAIIGIEGMTCCSCVQNIESNLSEERGVASIKVSLQTKTAEVAFNTSLTTPQKLVDAINALGFESSLKEVNSSLTGSDQGSKNVGHLRICNVGIDGMTCHSCVTLIESVVGELEGVVSITVSLTCKEGTVEFNDASTSTDAISTAVEKIGFVITYIAGMY